LCFGRVNVDDENERLRHRRHRDEKGPPLLHESVTSCPRLRRSVAGFVVVAGREAIVDEARGVAARTITVRSSSPAANATTGSSIVVPWSSRHVRCGRWIESRLCVVADQRAVSEGLASDTAQQTPPSTARRVEARVAPSASARASEQTFGVAAGRRPRFSWPDPFPRIHRPVDFHRAASTRRTSDLPTCAPLRKSFASAPASKGGEHDPRSTIMYWQ